MTLTLYFEERKSMRDKLIDELFDCLQEIKYEAERVPAVPHTMSRGHLNVLYGVYFLSRESGQVKITDVGKKLRMQSPNVIAIVKDLERQGCLKKLSDTRDRRVVHVKLTAEGKAVLERYVLNYFRLLGRTLEGQEAMLEDMVSGMQNLLGQIQKTKAEFLEQLGGIENEQKHNI
ncbi:MAG: winged helix DNA-binding protein [Lachnospiraceae bacterium]|nr:winged helix DNA-binding protein [Lachnospiraceae bacterium]